METTSEFDQKPFKNLLHCQLKFLNLKFNGTTRTSSTPKTKKVQISILYLFM